MFRGWDAKKPGQNWYFFYLVCCMYYNSTKNLHGYDAWDFVHTLLWRIVKIRHWWNLAVPFLNKFNIFGGWFLLSSKKIEVPIWEKSNLTVEETAAYSGIGINKIREMSNKDNCPFVLWVGNKRMIKRKAFDTYIESCYSI